MLNWLDKFFSRFKLPRNSLFYWYLHKLAFRCEHGVDFYDKGVDLKAHDLVLVENKLGANMMVTGGKNHR